MNLVTKEHTMKKTNLFTSLLLSLTLGATLGACQAQSDDELSDEDYDDIAAAMSGLLGTSSGGGEVGSMADASAMANSGALANAEGDSGVEIVVRAGLSYEYRIDCFDITGGLLDLCSELTDSADVSVDWRGELDTPRYQSSIQRTGSWSLTGLQSGTAELSGTGSFDIESSFMAIYRDTERTLDLSYDAEYEGVQIDTSSHTVVGGTVRYSVQGSRLTERGDRNRDGNFSVDAEVTFNADSTATLLIDRARSYEVNLDSGEVIASASVQ